MLILATTIVELFKMLILATIFVKLFKLFSSKALSAWVNVFLLLLPQRKIALFLT